MSQENDAHLDVLCVGAGPAGLTSGYLLSQQGLNTLILEKNPIDVGGISRTVEYKGYRFDIGGHRFFSKSSEVNALWRELLGDDLIERPRKSRIYYKQQFFTYPLKAFEALIKLGPITSLKAILSYFQYQFKPIKNVRSFEDWVTNQFGRQLFNIFFKTYTEKIWGMPCGEISADWAAQRIKGLSLWSALKDALLPQRAKGDIKTLINHFYYPRLGPGMMWQATRDKIHQLGNEVRLDSQVSQLCYNDDKSWTVHYYHGEEKRTCRTQEIISSMPLRELVLALTPAAPAEVIDAAKRLKYRDFLIVALMINHLGDFDDNWVYIHDPKVKVGRVQNFRSWSPEMITDDKSNCYGMEYFCFEGDNLWSSDDKSLIAMAKKEIDTIGLAKKEDIFDAYVIREAKAYPVYDDDYKKNVALIAHYLESTYPSLHLVGRNGMHKYNNQDHAMMTAMLTVKNILAKERRYDVWRVNEDALYHESGLQAEASAPVNERLVPTRKQS